jgi:hypothetical protein
MRMGKRITSKVRSITRLEGLLWHRTIFSEEAVFALKSRLYLNHRQYGNNPRGVKESSVSLTSHQRSRKQEF